MKVKIDVQGRQLNVYTKFQTHISKHIDRKTRKLLKNAECTKTIAKILKIRVMGKTGLMSRSIHLCDKFERFILIYEAMIAKISVTYF